MSELISELRNATAQIHKSLEETAVSKTIMSSHVSLRDYSELFKRLYLLHSHVEQKAFPQAGGIIKDLPARKKSELLLADLAQLKQYVPTPDHTLNNADYSPAFSLGMIYVTEGSSLGGQYISKNILSVLGSGAERSQRYFNAYGAQTGSLWKHFLSQLNEFGTGASEQEKAEVLAGAIYGFKKTADVFNPSLPQLQL